MKKTTFIILCLALCVSIGFSSPQEEEYYSYSFARLNYVNGDVYIQRAEDMGYEEGTVNLPLVMGDKLGTRDGRAEIHFGKRNYLRVDKDTQIDFVKLPQRAGDSVSLHLFSGSVYLRINSLDAEKEFELHSPDGSFYILEEGLYRFDVRDNQETALIVMEGSIEAAGEGGSEIIRTGEKLIAANGFFTAGPEYIYAGNEDTFSEWNRGRDAFHNRYVKSRYLPVDLYDYEAELDYYGRWVYERPYGYVWIPDVYHYSWRPYFHGRWVWYPICGWTWCSYEPWGWCVSHYGRWHWRTGLGWYWIPTSRWGPAWVHWYHGADYIGWSPLSFYNRPVVIVNNRFYGNYNDRYYPVHSRAFTVLRRDQLGERHVSKVALSQSGMSRLGKIALSSRQPDIRPSSSRLNVKGSVASQALSRSNIRSVAKSYSSGTSIRSSAGRSLNNSLGASRISTGRSGTVSRGNTSPAQKSVRTQGAVRSIPQSHSIGSRDSRSTIRTYPSRRSSSVNAGRTNASGTMSSQSRISPQMSRSTSRSSSSPTGIKTYPSQRNSIGSSRSSETSKARAYSPSSSKSYRSTVKQYSPRMSTSVKSRSSRSVGSSYSSALKQYSSPSQTRTYKTRSRSAVSSRSSNQSSFSRPSYSTPSRSSVKIRSSSGSRSYSSGRVSSSRISPSRVSRPSSSRSSASTRSSRSSSSSRIKKK
jgi:hypothetical protein